MLVPHGHPALTRVDWVTDLLVLVRSSTGPRWVATADGVVKVDCNNLRSLVAGGLLPRDIDQPAELWLIEETHELLVSPDGNNWTAVASPHDCLSGFLGVRRGTGQPERIASFTWVGHRGA